MHMDNFIYLNENILFGQHADKRCRRIMITIFKVYFKLFVCVLQRCV